MTEWLGRGEQALGPSRPRPRRAVGPLWLDPEPSRRV